MSTAPWFKFYPGDYLADTQRLTQAQHGAYILILLDYYSAGEPPPDDDSVLMSVSHSESLSDWLAIRKAISRLFQIEQGKWFHKRCDKEIAARLAEHTGKSEAGKKGNEIRWGTSLSDSLSVSQIDRNTRYQIPDTRSQTPNPEKNKPGKVVGKQKLNGHPFALPEDSGIDPGLWSEFLEMRTKIRKPATDRAKWLIIGKLANLQAEGHNPRHVLQQSIRNSWQDVFPLRGEK